MNVILLVCIILCFIILVALIYWFFFRKEEFSIGGYDVDLPDLSNVGPEIVAYGKNQLSGLASIDDRLIDRKSVV